jgi:hypothetical protein
MSIRVRILLASLLLLLFAFAQVRAQALLVQQRQPLPNQLRLSDLFALSLSNPSARSVSVTFRATVTEARAGRVCVAGSEAVDLRPGTRSIDARSVEPIALLETAAPVQEALRRTSAFPDGEYTVCVDVLDAATSAVLASSCIAQKVSSALPPILIGPYDGSDVADNLVVWSWFMQPSSTNGAVIRCELRVVEILEGQTPEEALRVNPPVIVRSDLTATAWQTSAAVRSFLAGHRYAWRVTAFNNGAVASESEIWSFRYNTPLPVDSSSVNSLADAHLLPTPDTAPKDVPPGADAVASSSPDTSAQAGPVRPAPFRISGRSTITLETADRRGVLSEAPARYARLEVDPRIELFNAPFEFSAIVTTERNFRRSDVNRGAFTLRNTSRDLRVLVQQRLEARIEDLNAQRRSVVHDSLREFLNLDSAAFDKRIDDLQRLESLDPASNIETLRGLGLITSADEVLLNLPELGFGKVAPRYSELFFNNVTINGGSFAYNPGNLIVGASVGALQREVNLTGFSLEPLQRDSSIGEPEFFRNIYGGRVGYGRHNGSNIVAAVMYADDDRQSRFVSGLLDSTATRISRQENYVLGVSGRLRFDSLGLLFDGEINSSLFNDNLAGGEVTNNGTAVGVAKIFGRQNLRTSSLADISYAARGSWQFDGRNARIFGGLRMVGPGYRSVGVAGLRNDLIRYDGGYEHLLFDRTVRINGVAGRELTGFVLRNATQSLIDRLGASLDYRPHALPSLALSYASNVQNITLPGDTATQHSRVDQFGFGSAYSYRVGAERLTSNVTANLQKGSSSDSSAQFTSMIFGLATRVAFRFPVSLFITVSQAQTMTHEEPEAKPVRSGDISLTWMPDPSWSATGGVRANLEKARTTFGLYFEAQAEIVDLLTLQLRLERNTSTEKLDSSKNFSENIAHLVTSVRLK